MYKPLGAIVVAAAKASVSVGYTMGLGPFESELELSHEGFYAIKAEIRQTPDAVIVLGDSIVQGAPLPKWICGYAVINAGVVGAAVEYFERHAAELLGLSRPGPSYSPEGALWRIRRASGHRSEEMVLNIRI